VRVLFLDIDGVLVTNRSHCAFKEYEGYPDAIGGGMMLDPDIVAGKFLWRFCKAYKIKIVMSSTWRASPTMLYPLLEKMDLKQFLHEDWRTIQSYDRRGTQIQEWLNRHPEVTEYRILDDDSDMLEEQEPFFIHTGAYNGITHQNMRELLNWVNHKYGISHYQTEEEQNKTLDQDINSLINLELSD
jgi:DNA-binding PadR family transcriptional regulator